MSSDFNLNFVADNFLSDDDWATHPLNVGLEETDISNGIDNDSESLLTNWSNESSTYSPILYMQHENETNVLDFNVNNLLDGVESPPLTPPDEEIDVDELLKDSPYPADAMHCEAFLDDLNIPDTTHPSAALPQLSLVRNRSNSNESSSTSAYSSQSATPPPKPLAIDTQDNFFFHDCSNALENGVSFDEGFHDLKPCTVVSSTSEISKPPSSRKSRKNTPYKTKKPQKRSSVIVLSDEETDFDRKVAEALKETNRLLNMHKMSPCLPPSSVSSSKTVSASQNVKAPSVDLKELCDSTILQSEPVIRCVINENKNNRKCVKKPTKKNLSTADLLLKELKRKALEKLKNESKEKASSAPTTTPAYVLADISAANTNQTIQSCQISSANPVTVQTPMTCNLTNPEPPVKVLIKQEPVSQLYLATTGNNAKPITLIRTTGNNLITSNSKLTQSSATKKEIPFHSLVIKSDQSATSNLPLSSLNLTKGQPTVKIVQNPAPLRPICTSAITVLSKSRTDCSNEKKTVSCSKSAAKPLMVAQPAKQPIVPNGNAVYSTPFFQNPTSATSPGHPNKITTDFTTLNNMDVETQNRVMKRQQRMIKNRQWACQSRQRRKEYLNMLEQRMSACVEDNKKLREINFQLKNRVAELEKENASLRTLAGAPKVGHRKAACLLMFFLFIGFNVSPMSYLKWSGSNDLTLLGGVTLANDSIQDWKKPVETSYHGRQLLAVVDRDTGDEQSKKEAVLNGNNNSKDLVSNTHLQNKYEYWMDDLVKNYKKEHISKILEIMQITSPVSLQRLLRRKLKEELGIHFPLSRHRRIPYKPSGNRIKPPNLQFDQYLGNTDVPHDKAKIPPSPPKIRKDGRVVYPCESLGKTFDQPNQTDSARVSDNLAKWIEQHEVDQRRNKKQYDKNNADDKIRLHKHKRKRRDSESSNSSSEKNSIPVLYEKRGRKLQSLLEAIDRKNDTVYMISFSKEHILLPASVVDSSGHTKMSLVLPTPPPNDSFVGVDQTAMIQINCEVHSTNYLKVDRDLFAGVSYTSADSGKSSHEHHHVDQNPKRRAFHGSKLFAKNEKRNTPSQPNFDDDATVSEDTDL